MTHRGAMEMGPSGFRGVWVSSKLCKRELFNLFSKRRVLRNEVFQSSTEVTAYLSSDLEQWLRASGGCCHGHRWCKLILQSFPHLLQNCKVIMRQRAAAPAYTHSDMFCSGSGGGFSLSVIIQELTVTYFSKGPALLPFSCLSHCLSLSELPALFFFSLCFRHFFYSPLPASVFFLLVVIVVIFVFLLLSANVAPCLAELNPQTRFCGFLLCRGSTQSQPLPPFTFRCHTPACLLLSVLFFFFSRPRFTTFVCQRRRWWISLLEDYSTFRLSRVSHAMICISLEAGDECVRLVEGCKGAFHRVNHLWCRPSLCLTADTRRVNRQAWPNSL